MDLLGVTMEGVQENSFGISKIVDCRLENGKQMYKVEWEATWEPAESLTNCQYLIDDFWSHVNKVKRNEHVAQNILKRKLNVEYGYNQTTYNLSRDDKTEIQKLVERSELNPPSGMLIQQNCNLIQENSSKTAVKTNTKAPLSTEVKPLTSSSGGGSIDTASLKYLENFTSPYVRIVVLCKICSKEQSLKVSKYWRDHYMTHQKPHQCDQCEKSFRNSYELRKHVQAKHGTGVGMKQEATDSSIMMTKQEGFY